MNESEVSIQGHPNDAASIRSNDDYVFDQLKFQDRIVPAGMTLMSCIFTLCEALCVLAILTLTYVFQSVVIADGLSTYSASLALIALLPCGGILALEYVQIRLTAGREYARDTYRHWVGAGISVLCVASLSFVHPLIGVPILLSSIAMGFSIWFILRKHKARTYWDFTKEEAVAFFSGRDEHGFALVQDGVKHRTMIRAGVLVATSCAFILALSISSWLAVASVLNMHAVVLVALISAWSTFNLSRFADFMIQSWHDFPSQHSNVQELISSEPDEDVIEAGLKIAHLSVQTLDGKRLLSDMSLRIASGTIVGVIGDSGAGKTLFQRVLADPFAATDLSVSGSATYGGKNLWNRKQTDQSVLLAHVEQVPKMLPVSGADNVSCFQSTASVDRGKKTLEQLVFSADDAQQIMDCSVATYLPTALQKALGLARSFLMAPSLYLFDRPEDGLTEKMVGALAGRIKNEARLGRCVLMATDNRALLEACDTLLVMHQGCIVDFGPAEDIRSRLSAGWARFVGPRELEAEENLENWVRSHFKRDGDEANRRKVCTTAAELLALSCQTQSGFENEMVSFEFKHFEGYCLLKMRDRDSQISSGVLSLAKDEGSSSTKKPTPLGNVLKVTSDFEQSVEGDNRMITVTIETYDPRKKQTQAKHSNVV